MKNIQFKCTLLSDVILNQKSASTGNQQTLDFIPGSTFLGIAAGNGFYDTYEKTNQLVVFHSSKVRFGDAHPLHNNKRTLRIPSAMYYPKLKKLSAGEVYIHHKIKKHEELLHLQLKQARAGFYLFDENNAEEIKVEKNFAIKSAYDREKRRSKDEQMYGYQSLEKGLVLGFELNFDDDVDEKVVNKIVESLTGIKTIGRSRTAQFGLVEIEESNFKANNSSFEKADTWVVLAESRLIFLDSYGKQTLMPTADDFGVDGGEILWDKSQIRTFRYSPWNFKRRAYDAERCCIEKGSVIVIKGGELKENSEFVGKYQNEGFGKVIFNPDFLESDNEGKSLLQFVKLETNVGKNRNQSDDAESKLNEKEKQVFSFLQKEKYYSDSEREIYKLVNEFARNNREIFKEDKFASQWGTIRTMAMQFPDKTTLIHELFDKKITRGGKEIDYAYLTHGVAKKKWSERKRKEKLKEFIENGVIPEDMVQFAVINLAAQMAKIYRR